MPSSSLLVSPGVFAAATVAVVMGFAAGVTGMLSILIMGTAPAVGRVDLGRVGEKPRSLTPHPVRDCRLPGAAYMGGDARVSGATAAEELELSVLLPLLLLGLFGVLVPLLGWSGGWSCEHLHCCYCVYLGCRQWPGSWIAGITSTISSVLPPLCAPNHSPSDVQMCGSIWSPGVLSRETC